MLANEPFKYKPDFEAAALDLGAGANNLLIYALSYYLDTKPDALLADITDGGQDQSADLVYFDLDHDRAIIAQGTQDGTWFKPQASTAKAASLGQAANWLLIAPLDSIPEIIKAKAVELRAHIEAREIDTIELLFVHNALESKPVRAELSVLADSLGQTFSELKFKAIELGANGTENLFLAATSLVAVRDTVKIPLLGSSSTHLQDKWKVVLATVPATAIYDLYDEYGDLVFSPNVRDYIGTGKTKKSINHIMKETATNSGPDFFVLNNGITLLTDKMSLIENGSVLSLEGVGVINGAQTTGVLHDAGRVACEKIVLQCRFLESRDETLLENAIRFNNTQNAVKAADRKSNDEVQKRLNREFELVGLKYVSRRSRTLTGATGYKIEADAMAQALCSYSGDLTTATRNRSTIWDVPTQYDRVFPSYLPWSNVWFVHLLTVALDAVVADIKARGNSAQATSSQKAQALFLSFSPSKQAIIFLFGALREQVMNAGIPDPFMWCAKQNTVSTDRGAFIAELMWALDRVISRVANSIGDEAAVYALVRTQSQLEAKLPELKTYFEDTFSESDHIAKIRQLTFVQGI